MPVSESQDGNHSEAKLSQHDHVWHGESCLNFLVGRVWSRRHEAAEEFLNYESSEGKSL